jgi:hypothetical protein
MMERFDPSLVLALAGDPDDVITVDPNESGIYQLPGKFGSERAKDRCDVRYTEEGKGKKIPHELTSPLDRMVNPAIAVLP